jgi:hypothetical protein
MPVPEYLTKRFQILIKFCNRIASRLEFLNLSLHIPAIWDERWETESMKKKKTDLRDERWDAESMEKKTNLRDERQRAGRGGGWENENGDLSLGLENMLFILVFFSRASLVKLGRFGSVQSVLNFENWNRTELKIFYDFLISLIGFFSRFSFFVYFFRFSWFNWVFGFFAHP